MMTKEELWDGTFPISQELEDFMNEWGDWEDSNERVWVEDVDRVRDGEYDQFDECWMHENEEYFSMTEEELQEAQAHIFEPCFEQAYRSYCDAMKNNE